MAKAVNAAIGVDIGYHTLKAVRLQRRGTGRVALTGYSMREIGDRGIKTEEIQHHLKLLLDGVHGKVKQYAVSVSSDDIILRVVEQAPTPVEVMRNALKFNAAQLLHEELNDYALDCDTVNGVDVVGDAGGKSKIQKYVVGGIPRETVGMVGDAFSRNRLDLAAMQIAPLSLFNAFEYARPEIFRDEPFILLDIGHRHSTVLGGANGEIVMIRTIQYGGKTLLDDLMMNGAIDREAAILLIEQGDGGLADMTEKSLQLISREVLSSIGFYEAQLDRTVNNLYVSGAASRAVMVLQALSDNMNFPCEAWDPFGSCDLALPEAKRNSLIVDSRSLNVAFGCALSLIRGNF